MMMTIRCDVNGCGDVALDGKLSLIAQEDDAGEHLQDGHAGPGGDAQRDEPIESIL